MKKIFPIIKTLTYNSLFDKPKPMSLRNRLGFSSYGIYMRSEVCCPTLTTENDSAQRN